MNRNFDEWFSTFRDSINDYDYYICQRFRRGNFSSRKNLKETFLVLDTLYNISDLEDEILRELFND